MNIGELFINLGLKGVEKTVGGLNGVRSGLSSISSVSLEAKAGIVGLLYGFERLMAASGAAGTSLTNFEAVTGLSAKTLQEWQFAARQAGDSNEDFAASLKGVQNSVSNMLLGKGAPEGLGLIAKSVKDFDPSKMRDTFYLMGKLQEAAQKLPKDIGIAALKSFGLSEGTIAAMRRGVFTEQNFQKAPKYGSGEIEALDKSRAAFSNLGTTIEMAFGHFNSKHGLQIAKDFTAITHSVLGLAEAFMKMSSSIHLFEGIDKMFQGWGLIFGGLTRIVDAVFDPEKRKELTNGVGEFINLIPAMLGHPNADIGARTSGQRAQARLDSSINSIKPIWDSSYYTPSVAGIGKSSVQNVDVTQNVTFQGHHEAPKRTTDALHKAAGDYVKQSAAKNQGS